VFYRLWDYSFSGGFIMPDYRCLKHDRVFESFTDHRRPGSPATSTLPAHPFNGHPDCPKCTEEARVPPTRDQQVIAARARAAAAAAKVREAQAEADAANTAVYDAAEQPVAVGGGRKIG
jgi:hypothetical protein